MERPHPRLGLDRLLRAEPLPAVLHDRALRPARGPYEQFLHVVLIEAGEATIAAGDDQRGFDGPVAVTLPSALDILVTLVPGCSGWLLGLSPSFLTSTLGDTAEAQLLEPLSRNMVVARAIRPIPDSEPAALAQRIHDEIADEGPGSDMIVQACLRLILAEIWRRSSFDPPPLGGGSEIHVLQGFRRLVEMNFRDHMKVAEYADQLGVTYDRLHRICRRNMQRSPLQLIHQRMMREAANWLERSGRSVQQIAHSLGFSDTPEFSHFFKRNSGLAPSNFRARIRNQSRTSQMPTRSFADWP